MQTTMVNTLNKQLTSLCALIKLCKHSISFLPKLGIALCLFVYAQNLHAQSSQSITEQLEQGLGLDGNSTQKQNAENKASQNIASQDSVTNTDPLIAVDSQQSLSSQIETLKQAMINLNRDLFILEEDLLFPSSTQVAVYLAMDVGEYFALDAVELRINGELKTNYLYTERQVNALYRGGVQRLYVGNVSQGEHKLTAYFVGIGPHNREYKRALSIDFTKDEDPIAIELTVLDASNKQQPIFEAKTL